MILTGAFLRGCLGQSGAGELLDYWLTTGS